MMRCQHCGKDIPEKSTSCEFCGKPVETAKAWYKQRWVLLIAVPVVIAVIVGCILVFSGRSGDKNIRPIATEAVTEASADVNSANQSSSAQTASSGFSGEEIIKKGYEKIGFVKLYNKIDSYKGAKIITAVDADDIGESALYSSLIQDNKTLAFYQFVFNDPKEIETVKKGEYVVIYGVVNPKGMVSSTIEVDECHIAAVGMDARAFLDSITDEKPMTPAVKPTEKPAAASASKATTAPTVEPTAAPKATPVNSVVSRDHGFIVSYMGKSYDEELEAFVFTFHFENNSRKDLFIGSQDSSVDGKPVDLLAVNYIRDGESENTEMFILQSDLDELGIKDFKELKFRFRYELSSYEPSSEKDTVYLSEFVTIKL